MLAAALEAEVATAAGAVPVKAPRVNDKRVDEASGQRNRFASAILPAWLYGILAELKSVGHLLPQALGQLGRGISARRHRGRPHPGPPVPPSPPW